jgi:hypothetical protein
MAASHYMVNCWLFKDTLSCCVFIAARETRNDFTVTEQAAQWLRFCTKANRARSFTAVISQPKFCLQTVTADQTSIYGKGYYDVWELGPVACSGYELWTNPGEYDAALLERS